MRSTRARLNVGEGSFKRETLQLQIKVWSWAGGGSSLWGWQDGRAAGAWRSAICLVKWGGVSRSGRGSGWRWVVMRGGAWRPWAWSDKPLQKTTGSWEGLRRLGRLEGHIFVHGQGGKNNCSLSSTTWQHLPQVIPCPETTWSNLT